MGKLSRDKGAGWEREVAQLLRPIWPNARRGAQARSGRDGPDVEGVPDLWIECKRGARTNPLAALAQAVLARGSDPRVPVAICRNDGPRAGGVAVLRLDDFVALCADPDFRAALCRLARGSGRSSGSGGSTT